MRKHGDAHDKGKICNRVFSADEPFLLGEDAFQNTKNTEDLLLVPFDRQRDAINLGPDHLEEPRLAEVRAEECVRDKCVRATESSHPWPEAWKMSHWFRSILSSNLSKLNLRSVSYFSTMYSKIASDSLRTEH